MPRRRRRKPYINWYEIFRSVFWMVVLVVVFILPNWESLKQELSEYFNTETIETPLPSPSSAVETPPPNHTGTGSYTVHYGEKPYSVVVSDEAVKAARESGQENETLINWGVPKYDDKTNVVEVNNNMPFFDEEDLTSVAYEYYTPLDELGRCGMAEAVLGAELFPENEREDISSVHPTGWWEMRETAPDVSRARCHLIAFMLAGENANEKNLITGSHDYFNLGMLPYESKVHDYIVKSANHVRYRVTPVFDEDGILARGVLMEAQSVEDSELRYCVFIYNAVPGYEIDYVDGIWSKQEK